MTGRTGENLVKISDLRFKIIQNANNTNIEEAFPYSNSNDKIGCDWDSIWTIANRDSVLSYFNKRNIRNYSFP